MPNHFHLMLEQTVDGGISHYMGRVLKSFTHIYNKEFNRRGTLWESKFKSKVILNDFYYLQCIRYIHLNPLISSKLDINVLEDYLYSSYLDVIKVRDGTLCYHDFLYKLKTPSEYRDFVNTSITDREIEIIKEVSLENENDISFS